jgi:RNA polymerase sigma-70 factor (ECF subfamily)
MPTNLECLYDEHAQSLFGFLLSLTRSEADTHDVLQEIFCKISARPGLLDGARDERAFLLRLAHNAAIDLMRRRGTREKNHASFAEEAPILFEPTTNADEENFQRALAEALASLPAEQRAVAHLKLWEGETFEQIAATLGIPPNTAASRYRYAIDKLRDLLRPLYEEIKNA